MVPPAVSLNIQYNCYMFNITWYLQQCFSTFNRTVAGFNACQKGNGFVCLETQRWTYFTISWRPTEIISSKLCRFLINESRPNVFRVLDIRPFYPVYHSKGSTSFDPTNPSGYMLYYSNAHLKLCFFFHLRKTAPAIKALKLRAIRILQDFATYLVRHSREST